MKIVSIVWFKVLPAKFGGQKGTAVFNQYLAAHFELTCLCSEDNAILEPLNYKVRNELPSGKSQFLQSSCWKKITDVVKEEKADVILLEYPYHAIAAYRAKQTTGAKIILHQHNIEHLRFKQLGKWWWRLLKSYEAWACRKADLILFKTEEDRNHAVENFGITEDKCLIVPYGIEEPTPAQEDIRTKHRIKEDEKLLLFAGTLDYEPNAEAVKNIYEKLVPQLEQLGTSYKVLICGRNKFPSFQYLKNYIHANVVQAGEVEDIAPYFQSADVFINPVLSGGGVQTKIIDALAHNCNVVAFDRCLQGIDSSVAANKIASVADGDWKSFAQSIQQMQQHKEPTPPGFFHKYSWRSIIANIAPKIRHLSE